MKCMLYSLLSKELTVPVKEKLKAQNKDREITEFMQMNTVVEAIEKATTANEMTEISHSIVEETKGRIHNGDIVLIPRSNYLFVWTFAWACCSAGLTNLKYIGAEDVKGELEFNDM